MSCAIERGDFPDWKGKHVSKPKWSPGPWQANLHHTQEQAGRTYGFIHAGSAVSG